MHTHQNIRALPCGLHNYSVYGMPLSQELRMVLPCQILASWVYRHIPPVVLIRVRQEDHLRLEFEINLGNKVSIQVEKVLYRRGKAEQQTTNVALEAKIIVLPYRRSLTHLSQLESRRDRKGQVGVCHILIFY